MRCEARTVRGPRCKSEGVVYRRHTDGEEYVVCARHNNWDFRPVLRPSLADPDDPIYKVGFIVGGKRLVGRQ